MEIANFMGGFLLLLIGLIIRIFKTSGLIAGYNTASREEKEKYNEEELTRFVGNMLIVSAAILLIAGFLSITGIIPKYMAAASWVLFSLVLVGGVIYMNTGGRFKKQQ